LENIAARYTKADTDALMELVRREPLFVRHLGHMRQRHDDRGLGFVLGAGVSEQAGVPLWRELISRLSCHYGDDGPPSEYTQKGYSATLLAQFIYNRFRNAERLRVSPEKGPRLVSIAVKNSWYRHIHESIYRSVGKLDAIKKNHPYLQELANIIYFSPFCLTLNFDDIVDRLAQSIQVDQTLRQRPNVIWKPPTIDRPNSCVIYHINGFLPQDKGARRSDSIILTEDSFADMLASPTPTQMEYIMSRVVSNSLLIIGASFEDPSLRNLFYAASKRNSAGFHYALHHDEEICGDNVDSVERADRRALNREMYNVITYFTTKDEISAIVRALNLPRDRFVELINELAAEVGESTTTRYYVVGSVSSGKSSLVERLRAFRTYEEWAEPPPELMFRDYRSLSEAEKNEVDDWVLSQLARKNNLMRSPQYGIHVMDRAPLDMFAFSESDQENAQKAERLRKKLNNHSVQAGQIVLLRAAKEALFERQLRRGRGPEWLEASAYQEDALEHQSEILAEIYGSHIPPIDTTSMTPEEVARDVAEIILFGDFREHDLEGTRKAVEGGLKLYE